MERVGIASRSAQVFITTLREFYLFLLSWARGTRPTLTNCRQLEWQTDNRIGGLFVSCYNQVKIATFYCNLPYMYCVFLWKCQNLELEWCELVTECARPIAKPPVTVKL